jgi:hypothetical protein
VARDSPVTADRAESSGLLDCQTIHQPRRDHPIGVAPQDVALPVAVKIGPRDRSSSKPNTEKRAGADSSKFSG